MILKKKILIVEDNEMNRSMLREILISEYDVQEAANGQDALDILKEQKQEISLILLDIMMPVMDGYTFLERLQENADSAAIPVIVTTQSDGVADEVNALSHGATDFVAKPYKAQVIRHRVASIIKLRETAAMMNLVQYDRLTGLYSKEFFYQKVRELLTGNPDKEYDIICSNVENFKLVNDVFGIPAGDGLLRVNAKECAAYAGDGGISGRLSSDRFGCLIERKREYVEEEFAKINERISLDSVKNVSVKWGIYAIHDRSVSVEQMCDRALLAATSIKGQYGRHFAKYGDELRGRLLREQKITDCMEQALEEGQFEVYLQPKYSIRSGELYGAEALVRWNHPEWGFQSPGEFIPLFERNGFITKLDVYVWKRTCELLEEWEKKGLPPVAVSVNVSRADIYQEDLTKLMLKIVQSYGLEPGRVHLEITESAYTENPRQIIDTVEELRREGFVIEMDDFGSGYSSLNMLNELPIDVLKLDMKFIQNETAKPEKQGVLRFIVALARWMELSVVAEGVETKDQLERLMEIGCDYVQGYYFARPMPAAEFEKLLAVQMEQKKTSLLSRREEPDRSKERKGVLVLAEADGMTGKLLGTYLKKQFTVVEAKDQETAEQKLSENREELQAVIVSLLLPEAQGVHILEKMQREQKLWRVPILAVGPADVELEKQAFAMGAADYAAYPCHPDSLKKRLEHMLSIHEMREKEYILKNEAYRDSLTGLLNQRGMEEAVDALRREDEPLAVYLFDLDNLKEFNERYGHREGDQQLIWFAGFLKNHTREGDVLARIGGDEFVVIMKKMWSEENAVKKGCSICEAVSQETRSGRKMTGCSAGVTLWEKEQPVEHAIKRAEDALHQAKKQKRGRCCLEKQEKEEAEE